MGKFCLDVLCMALGIPLVMLEGYVASRLWRWFMVPWLDWRGPTWWQASGVFLLVFLVRIVLMVHMPKTDAVQKEGDQQLDSLAVLVAKALVVLVIWLAGWLVS